MRLNAIFASGQPLFCLCRFEFKHTDKQKNWCYCFILTTHLYDYALELASTEFDQMDREND